MSKLELNEQITALATLEYGAWKARNAARKALREWRKKYTDETGEWYDEEEALPEDIAAHNSLERARKHTQREFTTARAATRRAVARAVASQAAEKGGEA